MTNFVLKIYAYMKMHRMMCLFSFSGLTLLLMLSMLRLNYKEDIADFLPIDSTHHNALKVYQDISGANRIFAVFQYKDTTHTAPDAMVSTIDAFTKEIAKADTAKVIRNVMSQVDMQKMTDITSFVYDNIPYFLTKADYIRMDSLLSQQGYAKRELQQDKQMLMFPVGGILADNIQRDPLNLFLPILKRLQRSDADLQYELYDGHIFSPDMQKAFVMISSPYGASETENNASLIDMLNLCATKVAGKNIDIHIIGGPVIAVTNAKQIKTDSILSVAISVILILALLLFSFRNVRNLFLIALSIAWGWLFAMGLMALLHDRVSVIVIGISSVILGIAVNYPLHFIAHLSHTPNKRKALREIVVPLLVGNVTTVGAFLALVPLQSVALRDLGLFSSLLLVGTIFFVLIYLPHISKTTTSRKHTFLDKLGNISLENKPAFIIVVLILTVVFGYFSFKTKFDANIAHINYMTSAQKADMAYFQRMMTHGSDLQKVYAISTDTTIDAALDKNLHLQPYLRRLKDKGYIHEYSSCSRFLPSKKEQAHRLSLWREFLSRHKADIKTSLHRSTLSEGFAPNSFDSFYALLEREYPVREVAYFDKLIKQIFSSNISIDHAKKQYNVISLLSVKQHNVKPVEAYLKKNGSNSFDVVGMNSAIASYLSNDFNYIGFACGFIVFLFLWLSMGSIELALLSFVPMAVSWVWILGFMGLMGMQFNIVNIILATFIFGQGDDYTIFMTEGAVYEYAYRRKMLSSYKQSIIISALIMFIGMGTLIVARHPALHSLAEVTITGMFSVVLMAYIFPPLIFKFLVSNTSGYRRRPVSMKPLLRMGLAVVVFFFEIITVYVRGFFVFCFLRHTEGREQSFRRYVHRLYRYSLAHIPSVRYRVDNPFKESFEAPVMVISNHQSMLDAAVFMALSPKLVLISNNAPSSSWVVRHIYRWLGYVTLSSDMQANIALLKERVRQGYSLVMFPEGRRNPFSSILRFHKGAFYIAQELSLDIVPVLLHGLGEVLPRGSFMVYAGHIDVNIGKRISQNDATWGTDYVSQTKAIHAYYVKEYAKIASLRETARYFHGLLLDRYRYKGVEVYKSVKKSLKRFDDFDKWVSPTPTHHNDVVVVNKGYGEFALLYALVHKDVQVYVLEEDNERAALISYCAEGITHNVKIISHSYLKALDVTRCKVFAFAPDGEKLSTFSDVNIISL